MFNVMKRVMMFAFMMVAGMVFAEGSQDTISTEGSSAEAPKYVFYFIGDGLGGAQRQVSEYYLQHLKGDDSARLVMNQFPVAGINTTHAADTLVTDSAAAGTALATGQKTNSGMISMLPCGTPIKTLMHAALEKNMGTGLITTTRLTHATPAVFASQNISRNNENEIADDFVASGVHFFAGGGLRHFVSAEKAESYGLDARGAVVSSSRKDSRDLVSEFAGKGYNMFIGKIGAEEFMSYTPEGKETVFAAFNNSHEPYEIDRINNNMVNPSLADMTAKGIEVLSQYEDGFFLMVEGGRIDHAAHANDVPGTIYDTFAFDDALQTAMDFYNKYPEETIIVVVGDHETGGLGMGFGTNYFLSMDAFDNVTVSVEDTLQKVYDGDREAYLSYIAENMGLTDLTEDELASLSTAADIVDKGMDASAFGGYHPVAIATTHILSNRANMYWTTYAHSGVAIPMSAIGNGTEIFAGFKDNTEIALALSELAELDLD